MLLSAWIVYLCNAQLPLHFMICRLLTTPITLFVGIECRNVPCVSNRYRTVRIDRDRCTRLASEDMPFTLSDERRLIAGRILHSGCVTCIACHKSIGDGAFEQVRVERESRGTHATGLVLQHEEDIFCTTCYQTHPEFHAEPSFSPPLASSKQDNQSLVNNDSGLQSTTRYGSMKYPSLARSHAMTISLPRCTRSFMERVHLYNQYNQKNTSHLNITEVDRCSSLEDVNPSSCVSLEERRSRPCVWYAAYLLEYHHAD